MARKSKGIDMDSICKEFNLAKREYKGGFRYLVHGLDGEKKRVFVTVPIDVKSDSITAIITKINDAKAQLEEKLHPRVEMEHYIEEYITRNGVSANTAKAMRRVLKPFTPDKAATNHALIDGILNSNFKAATKKLYVGMIHHFFNWMADQGYTTDNPAKGVQVRRQYTPRSRIPTDADCAALEKWAFKREAKNPGARLYLALIMTTGARVSTVAALKVGDLRDGKLYMYNVKTKKPYDVAIPITDPTLLYLWNEYTRDKQPSELVFDAQTSFRHMRALSSYMAEHFPPDATGESLSPHSFRHKLATDMLQKGVPLDVVSKILDHSSVAITLQVYARHSQEQINDAFAALAR